MPVARTHGAPLRVGSAGDVLDLLQPFLDVGIEVRPRLHHLPAQRVSGIDAQQRLHVQVLAPFQEFQQSHAIGGVVAPRGGVRRTVDQRADHFLPIETGLDPVAFEVVSPGEAQERGTHGGQLLHDVDAVPVRPAVIGGREQGNQLEPQSRGSVDGQLEMVLGGRGGISGLHLELVLLPAASGDRDRRFGENLSGLVRHERNPHRQWTLGIALGE